MVTNPQVSLELYCKWLTDKYNRDTKDLAEQCRSLDEELKKVKAKLKRCQKNNETVLREYMDDKRKFDAELAKDAATKKHKEKEDKLRKQVDTFRQSNKELIAENIKLKKQLNLI